jgi:hypothetical protein
MEKIQRMLWMVIMTIFSVFGLSAQMQPIIGEDLEALKESLNKGSEVHRFEKNEGQFDPDFHYAFRDRQAMYFFDPGSVTTVIANKSRKKTYSYKMNFIAPSNKKRLVGNGHYFNNEVGVMNYILADGSSVVKNEFDRELNYENLWEGIDARFYGTEEGMKYDFIVRPGYSPDPIEFEIEGATNLLVTAEGELAFETPLGEIKKGKPYTYQLVNNKRVEVSAQYLVKDGVVSFEVDNYDPSMTLYIDPIALKYATFLGRKDKSINVRAAHYDPNTKNIYFTGSSENESVNFSNSIGNLSKADHKIFVACLSERGDTLRWNTVITSNSSVHGTDNENTLGGIDLIVGDDGDVYVYGIFSAGENFSPNATVPGIETIAFTSSNFSNRTKPALLRLNASGAQLKYFTYLFSQGTEELVLDDGDYYTELFLKRAAASKKMVFRGDGKIALIMPMYRYAELLVGRWGGYNSEVSALPFGKFAPTPGVINTLTEDSYIITGVYEINTNLSGTSGLLKAAYFDGITSSGMAQDGHGNLYFTGGTAAVKEMDSGNLIYNDRDVAVKYRIPKYSNDLITTSLFPIDTSLLIEGSSLPHYPGFVLKTNASLTQPMFGSWVHPQSSVALINKGTSNITVDADGNIYFNATVEGPEGGDSDFGELGTPEKKDVGGNEYQFLNISRDVIDFPKGELYEPVAISMAPDTFV